MVGHEEPDDTPLNIATAASGLGNIVGLEARERDLWIEQVRIATTAGVVIASLQTELASVVVNLVGYLRPRITSGGVGNGPGLLDDTQCEIGTGDWAFERPGLLVPAGFGFYLQASAARGPADGIVTARFAYRET